MKRLIGLLAIIFVTLPAMAGADAPRNGDRDQYLCEARALLGKRFSATGSDEVATQDAALKLCEAEALRCYATGCKKIVNP